MITKIYKCCICHKILDKKPHRLIHQEYKIQGYGAFKQIQKFDYCDKCFKVFRNWIQKHKEV